MSDTDGLREVIVTPEMIVAGLNAFHEWGKRWDYMADGYPGDWEATKLVLAIYGAMAEAELILCSQGNQ